MKQNNQSTEKRTLWQRYRSARKRTQLGIGCGALIVILALCGISSAIISGGNSSPSPTVQNSPTVSSQHTVPTPQPTPVKTHTMPNRTQVENLVKNYPVPGRMTLKSYDQKTGSLAIESYYGYGVVADQNLVKSTMQDLQKYLWVGLPALESVTVTIYHYRHNAPSVKLAYSTLTYQTAQTINWQGLFGPGDLWSKYDHKWMDSKQADFDGENIYSN